MQTRTTVALFKMSGLALIVPMATGVFYWNQTGGHACLQTEMEGFFVPIGGEDLKAYTALNRYFIGPKWSGWCWEAIDEETADQIDRILAELRLGQVVVDRDKLECSWESWVHVQVVQPLPLLVGQDSPTLAILTWPNSD